MADYRRGGVGGRICAVRCRPTGAEPPAPIAERRPVSPINRRAASTGARRRPRGVPHRAGRHALRGRLRLQTAVRHHLRRTSITADKETIGNWSDDRFVRAVREGIGPQGNLYPASRTPSYTGLSRDDVLAIKSLSVRPRR
ncbi:hypothetical protein M8494_11745 [Serratia ureilytica]